MKKLFKRFTASALAVALALGSVSMDPHAFLMAIAEMSYGLYVGNVQVTSDNLTINSDDNASISGSAVFDAETNTLTLNNFSYSGPGYNGSGEGGGIDYRGSSDFNILLVGNNTITKSGDSSINNSHGIYYRDTSYGQHKLVIDGEGTLTIGFDSSRTGSKSNGIFCEPGGFEINGGTVTSNAGRGNESAGIYASRFLTFNGGNFTANGYYTTAYESRGIYCSTITINGGVVKGTTPVDNSYAAYGFHSSNVTINDGEVIAIGKNAFSSSYGVKLGSETKLTTLLAGDDEASSTERTSVSGLNSVKYAHIYASQPIASVTAGSETTDYDSFSDALSAWTDGSTLVLLKDAEHPGAIEISGARKLDLNGHKLTTNDHFYIPSGSSLEVCDSKGGGLINAEYRVGAVFWLNGGKLTLNGGTVKGDISTAGMVDIAANAELTMNGGKITGTSTGRYDASVIRFTGSNGKFTMTGGEISDTTTQGGVTYFEKLDVSINISGSAKIYNNKLESGASQNLYIPNDIKININGDMDDSAKVFLSMQTPGVFTDSTNTNYNDASKFTSDDPTYTVGKNADGQLILGEPVSRSVTFKVVNGSWDDDTTADKTVDLEGASGGELKLTEDDIPAVGSKPADTYKAGSWDTTPDTDTAITEDVTYTYTYENKEKAEITTAPTAKTLTYNGSAQALVTAGTAEGGEMRYALGNEESAEGEYSISIPTAVEAGDYYVWYMAAADEEHLDSDTAFVKVTIAPKLLTVTADPVSKTYGKAEPELTYTAEGLVGTDTLTGELTREAGENVGTYAIKQGTLSASDNYTLAFEGEDLTINKAAITITADDKSSKYKSDIAELTYQVGGDYVDGDDLGVTISTSADSTSPVGEYDITVDWNENPNYTAKLSNGKYTITKSDLAISASGYSGTYDGKAHGMTVYVGDPDAVVYYGTTKLTASNYKTKGSTTNLMYTNAGEYTVYYFVDSKNYEPTPISGSNKVSIAKADPTYTAPTAKSLTYNGNAQELVNAGSAEGGTMQYSLDGAAYSADIPKATDVGNYTVYYKVVGDDNHNDTDPQQINVTIAEAPSPTTPATPSTPTDPSTDTPSASKKTPKYTAPTGFELDHSGKAQVLIKSGTTDGGTFMYSTDGKAYSTYLPQAADAGTYTIYYYIKGSESYTDLGKEAAPLGAVSTVITTEKMYVIRGYIYQPDGKKALSGANIRLMSGGKEIASTVTGQNGYYRLAAKAGVYNIIVEWKSGGVTHTRTDIVTVPMEDDVDITMPSGNVNSNLTVAKGTPNVAVGGLDEEAEAIRLESGAKDVTLSMFIESKTESKAANADKIRAKALPNQDIEYLDIRVESTVDSVKKTMDKTHTVLEIAIPYNFGGKESVMLYRYHDGKAALLTENDSEKDGTYYLDKENGYIHLYTDRFSTYAIGYIQCYNITGIVKCGSYKGKATVTLLKKETNGEETQSAQSILDLKESKGVYTFDHVQKGTYILITEWTDGEKTSVLKEEIEVK